MSMLEFDTDTSRQIEAIYTTDDVVQQRRVVRDLLAAQPGERVLDIGAGPGFLAAELATAVGPGGRVCGIDISDDMLAIAQTRADVPGGARVELERADANHIPYPDESFDVATATQVLEYVADLPGALAEIRRVLRPGGRVLLLDTDWHSVVWHSRDNHRMARVLAAFEEHLHDPYLPRTLTGSLKRTGFDVAPPQVLPLFNAGYERATYSAGLLEIVAAFVPGRGGVTQAKAEAWADDLRALGSDYFFSINRYVFCATRRS